MATLRGITDLLKVEKIRIKARKDELDLNILREELSTGKFLGGF